MVKAAQTYDYVVVGYGKSQEEALKEAERKLPHPINDPTLYGRLKTEDTMQVGPSVFKAEIKYDLKGTTAKEQGEARKAKQKSSSAGQDTSFALTRDLTDVL